MEKAGLKTFVYSFVFSLFTLFSVHRAFLHIPAKRDSEAKIPNKNITLFLKDVSHTSNRIQGVPAKKIALSVLPEIPSQIPATEHIPLTADELKDASPALTATADIPLQGFTPQKADIVPKNVFEKETVIQNFAQIIKSPPPIERDATENILLSAPHSFKPTPEEKTSHLPEEKAPTANREPLPDRHSPLSKPAENIQRDKIVLAQNNIPALKANTPQSKNKPEPLIPLEKNGIRAKSATNEIKTADDTKENQVALNARNIPIKSMISDKASHDDEQRESEWQSMSEKHSAKAGDTPWIVAKGGKFPRNEMVLQDKAYLQDEEEIRRVLSDNSQNIKTNKSGAIKLAAETAKNLLIPIPDEIMKEKNITPKLVSSDKNQIVEEEPATREKAQDIHDAEEKTPPPTLSSAEKEGGLLNSLSSIFSSKKNTPQIGNSIEESPEKQNSLLSAFTRKKTRITSKILPTEIRLSFQPNRAEISGQTLKWIRAFAQKTTEEAATGLEIRIDGTSSPLLQRRRLNLLQNILINEGADQSKIRTVFTAREPNSFILRTTRINSDNTNIPQNRNIAPRNNYMQW